MTPSSCASSSCAALCRKCHARPSTGVVFDLCDPCFDDFESTIAAGATASENGKYTPTSAELEYVNEPFIDRSAS